jgi:hypothetical protein
VTLTDDERDVLEYLIGIGQNEIGPPGDEAQQGARKLGLNPYDWHGNRWFDEGDR